MDPETDLLVRQSLDAVRRSAELCRASERLCERTADTIAQSLALLALSDPLRLAGAAYARGRAD